MDKTCETCKFCVTRRTVMVNVVPFITEEATDETCRTCRFCNVRNKENGNGECRRRAPIYTDSVSFRSRVFPSIYLSDWCGEYELKDLASLPVENLSATTTCTDDIIQQVKEMTISSFVSISKVPKDEP